MSRKKKREFHGIQINSLAGEILEPIVDEESSPATIYIYGDKVRDLTIDCHLGSIILTKDEILDYLELVSGAGLASRPLWRDIQEELPQRDGIVLVYCPSQKPISGLTALAWYNPENGWSQIPNVWLSAITHWQPIPVPPKKRSEAKPKAEA